jgi:hypothetical protein
LVRAGGEHKAKFPFSFSVDNQKERDSPGSCSPFAQRCDYIDQEFGAMRGSWVLSLCFFVFIFTCSLVWTCDNVADMAVIVTTPFFRLLLAA